MEPGSNLVHHSALLFYIWKLKPNEFKNRHENKKAPLVHNIKLRNNYCTDLLICLQIRYVSGMFFFLNRQPIFLTITVSPMIMPKLKILSRKVLPTCTYLTENDTLVSVTVKHGITAKSVQVHCLCAL